MQAAEILLVRDSPEPLSISSSVQSAMPRLPSHSLIATEPLASVPGAPPFSKASVSSRARAIGLMLNLFTRRITSPSVSDS